MNSTADTAKWRLIYDETGILTHFYADGITHSLSTIELFDTEEETLIRSTELGYPEYSSSLAE